jgi:hypothetical protein
MWGYVPVKERLQLDGDDRVSSKPHYLTFLNNFRKWDRQVRIGLIPAPPIELMRREFSPIIGRAVKLLGRNWCLQVVNETMVSD